MAIDFLPLVEVLVPGDIVSVVLSVAVVLGGLYVVCFGVIAVLVTVRGGSAGDQFVFLRGLSREPQYRDRYRREVKNRDDRNQYRDWKRSKGYK